MKNLTKYRVASILIFFFIAVNNLFSQQNSNALKLNILPSQNGIQFSYDRLLSQKVSFTLYAGYKKCTKGNLFNIGQTSKMISTAIDASPGTILSFGYLLLEDSDRNTRIKNILQYQSHMAGMNINKYFKTLKENTKFQGRMLVNIGIQFEFLHYKGIKNYDITNSINDNRNWISVTFESCDLSANFTSELGYQMIYNNTITLDLSTGLRWRSKDIENQTSLFERAAYQLKGVGHLNRLQFVPGIKLGLMF